MRFLIYVTNRLGWMIQESPRGVKRWARTSWIRERASLRAPQTNRYCGEIRQRAVVLPLTVHSVIVSSSGM
jgi:hypothetical protein